MWYRSWGQVTEDLRFRLTVIERAFTREVKLLVALSIRDLPDDLHDDLPDADLRRGQAVLESLSGDDDLARTAGRALRV